MTYFSNTFSQFLSLTLLCLTISALCLSRDDSLCINKYSGTLDNDFLIGTWYEVYGMADWVIGKPSPLCKRQIFYKMDADQTEIMMFLFKILNMPLPLINPIYTRDNYNTTYGVLSGSMEGKIFLRDPKHVTWRTDNTEGKIYKYVNENMVLYRDCGSFGNKWYLLSRNRNVDSEQVESILNNISDITWADVNLLGDWQSTCLGHYLRRYSGENLVKAEAALEAAKYREYEEYISVD